MTPYLKQFSTSDQQHIALLLENVDALKEELGSFIRSGNTCNTKSLQLARLRGSNTLLHRSDQLNPWNLAIQTIWSWIQQELPLNLGAFFQLNRILMQMPNERDVIRECELSVAGLPVALPQKLKKLLMVFEAEMASILESEHPLIQAAWVYQNLVAIHPFNDANGRTSRLAADWILARGGFPPLVFLSPVAAMVPLDSNRNRQQTQLAAIARVAGAIQTSAQILTMRQQNPAAMSFDEI